MRDTVVSSLGKGTPLRPYLRDVGGSKQLMVNDRPFLMLAAELQNSSMSSSDYMDAQWAKLKKTNANTVLGCVAWEQIEPVEGEFSFAELDKILNGAASHDLNLVLLWFGSFKNGRSTYVPSWVKKNDKRFPRMKVRGTDGQTTTSDTLSIFGTEAQKADARAFGNFMQYLKDVDSKRSTVLMVQVENEVGLLGDSRDRSDLAEQRFKEPVPKAVIASLDRHWDSLTASLKMNLEHFHVRQQSDEQSWADCFGESVYTDELFMAYHYALYVNEVAAAGKSAYPLPLYTNVWQNYAAEDRDENVPVIAGGGAGPGDYPSGGGVVNVLDIWQLFAPALDFIAPDVYLNDYSSSCTAYRHRDQPLFIPEQRRDDYGARRIWKAFGSFRCLGTSPFGMDTLEPADNPFTKHYALLAQISTPLLDAQTRPNSSVGFFFDELLSDGSDPSAPINVTFGDWELSVQRSFVFGRPAAGSGLIIHLGGDEFLLVGWGFQVIFKSCDPRAHFTGILSFKEQEVVNSSTGEMKTSRWLNGDETQSGKAAIMPSENPDYGGFPISVTIPARTGIAICEPYMLSHK